MTDMAFVIARYEAIQNTGSNPEGKGTLDCFVPRNDGVPSFLAEATLRKKNNI
jgi:hypothetical protein